jgi:hypothetical protein
MLVREDSGRASRLATELASAKTLQEQSAGDVADLKAEKAAWQASQAELLEKLQVAPCFAK